jgi:beta-glucosidase
MQDGVNVRRYFVWSSFDKFEWKYGYTKRFGFVHLDYEIQKRTIKDNGEWNADIIRSNQVT